MTPPKATAAPTNVLAPVSPASQGREAGGRRTQACPSSLGPVSRQPSHRQCRPQTPEYILAPRFPSPRSRRAPDRASVPSASVRRPATHVHRPYPVPEPPEASSRPSLPPPRAARAAGAGPSCCPSSLGPASRQPITSPSADPNPQTSSCPAFLSHGAARPAVAEPSLVRHSLVRCPADPSHPPVPTPTSNTSSCPAFPSHGARGRRSPDQVLSVIPLSGAPPTITSPASADPNPQTSSRPSLPPPRAARPAVAGPRRVRHPLGPVPRQPSADLNPEYVLAPRFPLPTGPRGRRAPDRASVQTTSVRRPATQPPEASSHPSSPPHGSRGRRAPDQGRPATALARCSAKTSSTGHKQKHVAQPEDRGRRIEDNRSLDPATPTTSNQERRTREHP